MPQKKKNFMKEHCDKAKKLDCWDIKLIKWSVVAWTLFLITVWPWVAGLVFSVHWAIWLALGVLFMIKPMIKYCSK